MKNTIIFCLFIAIWSCRKDDTSCFEEIGGNYFGTCTSIDGVKEGSIYLSQAFHFGLPVTIVDDIFNHNYIGTVSEDCTTIEIDYSGPQTDPFSIIGTFQIQGDSITGDMTISENNVEKICSYSVTKI